MLFMYFFLFWISCFSAYVFAVPSEKVLNAQGYICQDVRNLLICMGADPEKNKILLPSFHIDDVVLATQGKKQKDWSWYQRGERWEMKANSSIRDISHAKDILRLIHKLSGFLLPQSHRPFKALLLLGSTGPNFKDRIAALDDHVADLKKKRGHHLPPICVLTGPRPLNEHEQKAFPDVKGGEPELLQHLMKEYMAKKALKEALHYQFVVSPIDPNRGRATTETTVNEWLKKRPERGLYGIVSGPALTGLCQWQQVYNCSRATGCHLTFDLVAKKVSLDDGAALDDEVIHRAAVELHTLACLLLECQKAWSQDTAHGPSKKKCRSKKSFKDQ